MDQSHGHLWISSSVYLKQSLKISNLKGMLMLVEGKLNNFLRVHFSLFGPLFVVHHHHHHHHHCPQLSNSYKMPSVAQEYASLPLSVSLSLSWRSVEVCWCSVLVGHLGMCRGWWVWLFCMAWPSKLCNVSRLHLGDAASSPPQLWDRAPLPSHSLSNGCFSSARDSVLLSQTVFSCQVVLVVFEFGQLHLLNLQWIKSCMRKRIKTSVLEWLNFLKKI